MWLASRGLPTTGLGVWACVCLPSENTPGALRAFDCQAFAVMGRAAFGSIVDGERKSWGDNPKPGSVSVCWGALDTLLPLSLDSFLVRTMVLSPGAQGGCENEVRLHSHHSVTGS